MDTQQPAGKGLLTLRGVHRYLNDLGIDISYRALRGRYERGQLPEPLRWGNTLLFRQKDIHAMFRPEKEG